MKYKYDRVIDEIKSMLPCQKGDIYYTIEKVSKIDREIKEDHGGNPVVMEYSTTIGKRVMSHYWQGIHEIIREMEHKNIGKRIFLTKEEAEQFYSFFYLLSSYSIRVLSKNQSFPVRHSQIGEEVDDTGS